MKKFAKVLLVILGILLIGTGISCLFSPVSTSTYIGYIIGLSMVLDAIAYFVMWLQGRKDGSADGWTLAGAILSAVFGFFILNNTVIQAGLDLLIYIYAAIWLIGLGIVVISRAARLRRIHKNWDTKLLGAHWYLPLCLGILLCAFGILCLFKPLIPAAVIGVFIGIGIISAGANMITLATTSDN